MRPSPLVPILIALMLVQVIAATITTEPVGFVSVTLPPGTPTTPSSKLIAVPFRMASLYKGSNVSTVANTLRCSPGAWTAGQFSTAGAPYYVRICSGNYSGRVFPISANTSDTITLQAASVLFGDGDRFEVFPAHTLTSLFGSPPAATGIQSGPTESDADLVRINDGSGWVSYFHNGICWRTASDSSSKNSTVIPPEQGVFIVRRKASSMTLTMLGAVGVTFERAVVSGTSQTVIGNRYPVPTPLNFFGVHQTASWRTGRSASLADNLLLWNGQAWDVFYHTGSEWRKAGAFGSQAATVIPAGEAALIRRRDGATGSDDVLTSEPPFIYSIP